MRTQFVFPVLAAILILGIFGSAQDVFAPKKLFVGGLSWDTDSQSFTVTGEVNHGMVKAVEKAGFTLQITINILDTQLTDTFTPSFDADGAFSLFIPWDRVLDDGSAFEGTTNVAAELQILNPAGKTVGNSVDKFERVLTVDALPPPDKTISIFFHEPDNTPIPNVSCNVTTNPFTGSIITEITDENGIATVNIPSETVSVSIECNFGDGQGGRVCGLATPGDVTEINIRNGLDGCGGGL